MGKHRIRIKPWKMSPVVLLYEVYSRIPHQPTQLLPLCTRCWKKRVRNAAPFNRSTKPYNRPAFPTEVYWIRRTIKPEEHVACWDCGWKYR